jgi:hypothetical protein
MGRLFEMCGWTIVKKVIPVEWPTYQRLDEPTF